MNSGGCVLALVGPTGSGKSQAALSAAERLGAEIVAIDAFTVYRGMSVGTAKPSSRERTRVPHHMVDRLDPEQECTVQWFQAAAREAIRTVHDRGRVALLVGGSGLYFRAVVDPLEFPPTDPAVRAALERRLGADAAHAHRALAGIDPTAARSLDPGNVRRVIRALEVYELTGRPFSEWRRAWDRYQSIYDHLRVIGVDLPRDVLTRRIAERVRRMLDAGWLEEARGLRRRALSTTARQAIGYAEIWDHLDGGMSWDQMVTRIAHRTRRFAVRQQRWFAADPRVRWEAPAALGDVLGGGC